MEATFKIQTDLSSRTVKPVVDAVQNDELRKVIVELTENGASWTIPAGVSAALAYRKPDGTSGLYDMLPDGTTAITFSGNTATVRLAPQALSVPGRVEAMLVFQDSALRHVSTFPFVILVAANPAAGKGVSNDYYNYQTIGDINAAIAALEAETDSYWHQLQDHRDRLDAMDVQLADLETAAKDAAPVIIATSSGTDEAICPDSVAGKPLRRLHLYGHTYVNGTATMEVPAQLTNDGDRGTIQIETGTDTVGISTPGGLAGVHTYRNESFTDENGQKWWSDSIEYKDGAATLVRRVKRLTLTGDEAFVNTYYPAIVLFLPSSDYVNPDTSAGTVCNYPVKVRAGNNSGTTLAFDIDKSQFPSGDAFKRWVKERYQSGNPVVVYYGLKTPVMEQLPPMEADALAALVTKDFTVVGSDTNGYMSVDYVADTKRYIDRKFEELSKALDALIGGGT